jgi:hypothetical protein
MRSYDPAGWQSFFVAIISAGAALTGLLFVAVSINLDRILKAATFLTTRAAETLWSPLRSCSYRRTSGSSDWRSWSWPCRCS